MRRCLLFMLTAATVLACGANHACAQAVQLPTYRYFSVNTTVSVPDRGGAVLGGVSGARSGTTSRGFGPLRNRAGAHEVGASVASVHATIIDHEELDREVLAEAARRREARGDSALAAPARPTNSKADFLARHVARHEDLSTTPARSVESVESIASVRAKAAQREERRAAEAAASLAAGKKSEEAGKFASARGHYEAAARLNVPEVSLEAAERLAKIQLPAKKSERLAKGQE